ncbi:MAG: cupin domain-containing protein [Bacteroidales bacterium]
MSTNSTSVFKLTDDIAYSEGSVVSKQIIKKSTGNVTLFAFDAGEGLSEHTAPFDALVHVIDGEAEVVIGGKSNIVGTDSAILMPANIPHALKANKRFKMILTMIKDK